MICANNICTHTHTNDHTNADMLEICFLVSVLLGSGSSFNFGAKNRDNVYLNVKLPRKC